MRCSSSARPFPRPMLTIDEIAAAVALHAARIGLNGRDGFPVYGAPADDGCSYIEVNAAGYHLVAMERGQETSRLTTTDPGELYYQIFAGVTFGMGVCYELRHRQPEQDCRRMIFARQCALLEQISPAWAQRRALEQAAILERHPFDDLAGERATLTRRLRESGMAQDAAWRTACARYPLPPEGEAGAPGTFPV